jgi:Raf kinase inhibitor-like YbhB/YbcL family protein
MRKPTVLILALAAPMTSCAKGAPKMTIELASAAFESGRAIPKKFTEDGSDVSPPLAWSRMPAGTKSFALVCDDPDAPTPQPWVHWVLYNIPGDATSLPENVLPKPKLDEPAGAMQGRNSWTSGRTIGYRGPAPPRGSGTHHYHFHLYALDAVLELKPEMDKAGLLRAIKGHVLGEGEIVGTYSR